MSRSTHWGTTHSRHGFLRSMNVIYETAYFSSQPKSPDLYEFYETPQAWFLVHEAFPLGVRGSLLESLLSRREGEWGWKGKGASDHLVALLQSQQEEMQREMGVRVRHGLSSHWLTTIPTTLPNLTCLSWFLYSSFHTSLIFKRLSLHHLFSTYHLCWLLKGHMVKNLCHLPGSEFLHHVTLFELLELCNTLSYLVFQVPC